MHKIYTIALLLLIKAGVSAQCLVSPVCATTIDSICDNTANNDALWNNVFFWDPILSAHDLAETEADLQLTVVDTCHPADRRLSFVLLLDLNGDGTQETAVWSDSLPQTAGVVFYGNAQNPHYSGGTAQAFDNRIVPNADKYSFALEQTVHGDTLTGRVRWVTANAPSNYVNPQLPDGVAKIRWFIESGGVKDSCTRNILIKDCQKPTIICLNGLSVNIMPSKMITLWASDFLQYAVDNITPADQIRYGIRKAGTGNGFPVDNQGNPVENVTFICDELGTQQVELWAIDRTGNTDYCTTWVVVQDNAGNCMPIPPNSALACTATELNNGLEQVSFQASGSGSIIPPFNFLKPSDQGCFPLYSVPLGADNITLTPIKDDNPLNGVTTFDLVLIKKHLLGLEPLNSPYKIIAGDADRSGGLSAHDIALFRRLILGIDSELSNNTSWRFVTKEYVFPNPANPFTTIFPESATITFPIGSQNIPVQFVAMKVGDVNGTAIANGFMQPDIETRESIRFTLPDIAYEAGQTLDLPVRIAQPDALLGFQCSLQFNEDQFVVEKIIPGNLPDMGADCFASFNDHVACSWADARAAAVFPNEPLFTLRLRARKSGRTRETVLLNARNMQPQAYRIDEIHPLSFQFQHETVVTDQTTVYAPQPNPTSGASTLPLFLARSGMVQLELMDMTGKKVFELNRSVEAGKQFLEIPANAMSQNGLYYWRIQVGDMIQSGKLVCAEK